MTIERKTRLDTLAITSLVACCFLWGLNQVAAKVAITEVPPLAQAAESTLAKVAQLGGDGGVICIDRQANVALPFNTPGMYRAFRTSKGTEDVAIFGNK